MLGDLQLRLCRQWEHQVHTLPFEAGPWRLSRSFESHDPPQGWKLHVSATILSAVDVLERARPVLVSRNVLFKVPGRLEFLSQLNSGLPSFSQIGKFLTAYPHEIGLARHIAQQLHLATRGLPGPTVPFDEPFEPGSRVSYRYGSFRPPANGSQTGTGFLIDREGHRHKDQRGPDMAVPSWLGQSFLDRPRACRDKFGTGGPLGLDFLPFRTLSRRGKGGVYEALDLTGIPARLCILKEGRPNGETQWDGSDGYSRVEHEALVLTELHRAGLPVPEVRAEFTQERNRYLVLAKLPGRALFKTKARTSPNPDWRGAERALDQLIEFLTALHSLGWVWRDCKPENLISYRGNLWALDFEGACRIEQTEAIPWSSTAYCPAHLHQSFRRTPGTTEDSYAAGVTAFFLATGKLPPDDRQARIRQLRKTGCPGRLCERLEALLAF